MKLLYSFVITLILFSVMTLTDAASGKDKSVQAESAVNQATFVSVSRRH